MRKINAILTAALIVLLASCSNAASDSNHVATPPASSSSMAPPVGTTPGGEPQKDNVNVKKNDSAAVPMGNTAPRTGSVQGGSAIKH